MSCSIFFFFNDTATTEIYTLSLHDALPIYANGDGVADAQAQTVLGGLDYPFGLAFRHDTMYLSEQTTVSRLDPGVGATRMTLDRKSTRLNSSHSQISYAVFCLKNKNTSYTR